MAGVTITKVLPQGDGNIGKDRYGYFSVWEWSSFQTDVNPNSVYYWYDSSYASGSWRNTYLQVGLDSLPTAADIVSASLNIYVTSWGDDGDGVLATLKHAANSSTATGNASDGIGGTEPVAAVTDRAAGGWWSFDVTSYIQNDVTNDYPYAAFEFAYDRDSSLYFASGEDTDYAPYLRVESASTIPGDDTPAVPVPSSVGLVLIGGLALWRKKNR